ncbi:WG repeat-containing protein [Flavobacterium sp. F372]|uniref:WG repeat-containing protein n=1 Tax=Flavobacterium bernardetii TaxID=2813823 RepID=A0ABR7IX29_9FLAO|nr:WG repeat-containing protein [Flavobacterium bernardetii]MBC5834328.1 WG repeat-containing protein [Flavobacterium bernardetii]NHF70033.1 WG repeat-containing protein [Flavobacterium bernardetii]
MKTKFFYLLFIPILLSCNFFKSGSEEDLFPFENDTQFGYFNVKGETVIKPQFLSASVFSEDIALVQTFDSGKFGYIDKEGKFIITAKYVMASIFNEGKAVVVEENGAPTVINKEGITLFTLKDADELRFFNEDLAAFNVIRDSIPNWGFVNVKGEKVIKPKYARVKDFYEGKCAVKNNDEKWGFIDKTGKVVIDFQFDDALDFNNGKAVVFKGDKAGVINSNGEFIIKPQYQAIRIDGDDFMIQQNEQYGWCDKSGKVFVKPQYNWISGFFNSDLALVQTDAENGYGYIDKKGKIVIKPQFSHGTSFFGDFAMVKSGEKYGIIDKSGKFTVKPKFESIDLDLFSKINTNGKYKAKFNAVNNYSTK